MIKRVEKTTFDKHGSVSPLHEFVSDLERNNWICSTLKFRKKKLSSTHQCSRKIVLTSEMRNFSICKHTISGFIIGFDGFIYLCHYLLVVQC